MDDKVFNLLHKPWIMVVTNNDEEETLSLLECFSRAHTLRTLSGEMIAQDVAILRLLLAVMYAVFVRQAPDGQVSPLDSDEDAMERWTDLWKRASFPTKVIESYLLKYEDRFWLFHPAHPFYQVPFSEEALHIDDAIIKPTKKTLSSLIGDLAESNNKTRLFANRTNKSSISFAEAARWLLYLNAFDVAPAGAPGNKKTGISIKGYGTGWLSRLGFIWANGNNLFETLMLNFVLYSAQDCQADWEKNDLYSPRQLLDKEPIFPDNLCELYTMQFRRVHLLRSQNGDEVTSYLLWSGQTLKSENALIEPMTIWMKKDESYLPKAHNPARQMWRDFPSILSGAQSTANSPGIVRWLSELVDAEFLKIPFLQLNIVGITFTNNTAVEHIFTDGLNVNMRMMSALGKAWHPRISSMLEDTNRLVYNLVDLVRDIGKASGDEDNTDKINNTIEKIFFDLDILFRQWIELINPETDSIDTKCEEWLTQTRYVIRRLGLEMTIAAGTQAYIGREIQEDKYSQSILEKKIMLNITSGEKIKWKPKKGNQREEPRRYSTPEAYSSFLYKTSL